MDGDRRQEHRGVAEHRRLDDTRETAEAAADKARKQSARAVDAFSVLTDSCAQFIQQFAKA